MSHIIGIKEMVLTIIYNLGRITWIVDYILISVKYLWKLCNTKIDRYSIVNLLIPFEL